jgi:4-hydroxy-tetrahydrodipicolinate reductase
MTIMVSVIGASGRMGKLALEVIQNAQDLELHSALDSKSELAQAIGADVIFEATKLEVSKGIVAFAPAL